MKHLLGILVMPVVALCVATPAASQEALDATARDEMRAMLGSVPSFIAAMPEHLQAQVWGWAKARHSPDAALPSKYRELIALAVTAQIPCDPCIHAHTARARAAGASTEEIREAAGEAARAHELAKLFSGVQIDLARFKADYDRIVRDGTSAARRWELSGDQAARLIASLGEGGVGGAVWFATYVRDGAAVKLQEELEESFLQAGWEVRGNVPAPFQRMKPGIFIFMADVQPPEYALRARAALEAIGFEVRGGSGYRDYYIKQRAENPEFSGIDLAPDQSYVIVVGPRS